MISTPDLESTQDLSRSRVAVFSHFRPQNNSTRTMRDSIRDSTPAGLHVERQCREYDTARGLDRASLLQPNKLWSTGEEVVRTHPSSHPKTHDLVSAFALDIITSYTHVPAGMSLRQFADVVAAAAAGVLLAHQAEGHAYLHYPISRQYARSRDFLHFRWWSAEAPAGGGF